MFFEDFRPLAEFKHRSASIRAGCHWDVVQCDRDAAIITRSPAARADLRIFPRSVILLYDYCRASIARHGGAIVHARFLASRFVVLVFAVFVIAGCGSKPVIGVLLPMTGDASSYGNSMKEAIDLAVAEAKADGSYPANLTIVWGDSASDPATGRTEIRRLAGAGAKLIVTGTTSGTAKAFLPELEDSDVIALSPSASAPSLTKDSKRFFRLFASDELEGQRAGRFLYEGQGKSTVLIFSQDSEQARGIEPFFRQNLRRRHGRHRLSAVSSSVTTTGTKSAPISSPPVSRNRSTSSPTPTRPSKSSATSRPRATPAPSAPHRPSTRAKSSSRSPSWSMGSSSPCRHSRSNPISR